MKKYLAILPIVSSIVSPIYAINIGCFEYVDTIDSPPAGTTVRFSSYDTIYPYQDDKLLNYKVYKAYTIAYKGYDVISASSATANISSLASNKEFQFDQYDTKKYIILKTKEQLQQGSFDLFVQYEGGDLQYAISKDGVKRQNIQGDISDYDIRYVKLSFGIDKSIQNTTIKSIQFAVRDKSEFVINSRSDKPISVYKNYNCQDDKLTQEINKLTKTDKFVISKNTTLYTSSWKHNSLYNTNLSDIRYLNDKDRDGVTDQEDNCPFIANITQKDSNADGVGDLCVDDDGDGIVGYLDNCIDIANSDQKDININNIGDVCEFDKDNDRIADSVDNCITRSNPQQEDSDADGIGNICDNCEQYNPDQRDADNNGKGDSCDAYTKEQAFLQATQDKDKDTILDDKDNCIELSNTNQSDTDSDGIGDVCDNCMLLQNTDQTDTDHNTVGDLCEDIDHDSLTGYLDNCPTASNPDQHDSDNNGRGDICEDYDHDSIIAYEDNCPYVYNPDQKDNDHDTIGDICDDKDNRVIESNKWVFMGIALVLIALFGGAIRIMIKKMNQDKQ